MANKVLLVESGEIGAQEIVTETEQALMVDLFRVWKQDFLNKERIRK